MPSASELLKSTGLLADGPVRWGAPVRSASPGIFIVELLSPVAPAPIDVSVCGKWAERVPTLLLDGERPDGKALQRRLASFWLPSQTVLYVASTPKSIGGRVASLYANELGTRIAHSGGHWLKTVRGLDDARIWWAETNAVEEAEDAVLEAFAAGVADEEKAALHDPATVLPFATLQTATGTKKETGLTGSLLPAPEGAPAGKSRPVARASVAASPWGQAAKRPAASRTTAKASGTSSTSTSRSSGRAASSGASEPPKAEAAKLTADGLGRLQAELDELVNVKRPENVQRIKIAREHGDLRENAEYQEARREQSFLEGRIQALEELIRNAVIVEAAGGHDVVIGSTVVVSQDGDEMTFSIVGSRESNPAEGRISYISPIGAALMGHRAGDDVAVATPSGERRYRIVRVS